MLHLLLIIINYYYAILDNNACRVSPNASIEILRQKLQGNLIYHKIILNSFLKALSTY